MKKQINLFRRDKTRATERKRERERESVELAKWTRVFFFYVKYEEITHKFANTGTLLL